MLIVPPALQYRPLDPGMGVAVAERTVLRKKADKTWENWGEVAERVALGNTMLTTPNEDYFPLRDAIAKATILMSGRHLQHGDETQPGRNMEVFSNCLHRDTKIITLEHGAVEIGKIAGKTVTVRARDGIWREAKVKSYGIQPLQKITFGSKTGAISKVSQEVTATPNHRWFLEDGSVSTDLKIGNFLEVAKYQGKDDEEAVRHGLIFGDGSAHKRRSDISDGMASQGREYCGIRLCGKDKNLLHLFEGYSVSYPPSAKGDPVVYLGKKRFWKDLPFCTDPDYIAGFIYGWWLADGSKTYDRPGIEISTVREDAIEWLKDYASFAGYRFVGMTTHTRNEGKNVGFANGKTLYTVRLTRETAVKVRAIEQVDADEVFCVEEPVTTGFVLANGLLTGNCSTSATSFLSFYLLLNGSGVGRCFDDDMMLVNWDNAPSLLCVLDTTHKDYNWIEHHSRRDAEHKFGKDSDNVVWFRVEDSREGWAKALETWEVLAFEKVNKDKLLILDFSDVRPAGSPIGGMQNRPASGPVPLMNAFAKAATLKGAGMPRWKQALYTDHYFAECVLVGGARRAARMSTKIWSDPGVLEFVNIKRPLEYVGKTAAQVSQYRHSGAANAYPFLWSSNNSIMVTEEFWNYVHTPDSEGDKTTLEYRAKLVFERATAAAYADGTGEPGFINADKLVQKDEGWSDLSRGDFVTSKKLVLADETHLYLSRLAKAAKKKRFHTIVNPCGEIPLNLLGGFCVIADVVPYHADTLEEANEAFRLTTRALIRTNLMDSIYGKEVKRTNRIGVGLTGVHEFAWKFFRVGFKELIADSVKYQARPERQHTLQELAEAAKSDSPITRALAFWATLAFFSKTVRVEAKTYSAMVGLPEPHTLTTIKPAGTTSKLFGLTEGWHLPSMAFYLRWVQFRHDDPLVDVYEDMGYPVRRDLKTYNGTTIVGFPTRPELSKIMPVNKLVTASEATPEEQFRWVSMGELFWINGGDKNDQQGGQISYTLKFDPKVVSYAEFKNMIYKWQPQVKCATVMPMENFIVYEYQPEEEITKKYFDSLVTVIGEKGRLSKSAPMKEDIDFAHIDCSTGACPVDFNEEEKEPE